MGKKRYAIVGSGNRSSMFVTAVAKTYRESCELVALCDMNQGRMDYYNNIFLKEKCDNYPDVPTYKADRFDRMIAEQKPDFVIVTSVDRTHHEYICRAMELGCDVISEKPMTVDAEKCQQIIDTEKRTGRRVIVSFNYRYAPRSTKIKEVVQSGIVGDITSIHFEWLLDTSHGADYFRRWHRNKNNSGGLLVHKSTHHFDLINWVMESEPETVFAMGDLKFYGRANAENRGVTEFYSRARNNPVAAKDPFALKMDPENGFMMGLYFNVEDEDGYYRDQSVFGDGIDIEDNMSVIVRYRNRAVMTYSLCAHCPWEGYRIAFNGTKGRLEINAVEKAFLEADVPEDLSQFGMRELEGDRKSMVPEILFQPLWGKAQVIDYVVDLTSGHGGGDARLLKDLFEGVGEDPFRHAAGSRDGAMSILTGIAANRSIKSGEAVKIEDLVRL